MKLVSMFDGSAVRFPDKPAIVAGDRSVAYRDIFVDHRAVQKQDT